MWKASLFLNEVCRELSPGELEKDNRRAGDFLSGWIFFVLNNEIK